MKNMRETFLFEMYDDDDDEKPLRVIQQRLRREFRKQYVKCMILKANRELRKEVNRNFSIYDGFIFEPIKETKVRFGGVQIRWIECRLASTK